MHPLEPSLLRRAARGRGALPGAGAAALALLLLAGTARPQDAASAPQPSVRLVVLVSVDQMRPEQLERLRPWLHGGFGRFLEGGQVWWRAMQDHANTETGPGHATLGTGVYPSHSGIVANEWTTASGGVYCCADPDTHVVASSGVQGDEESVSSRQLLVRGLADFLHQDEPAAIAIGISMKDRAAILATGQHADLALWWDRGGRGFVTSDAYAKELPGWVVSWNDGWAEPFLAAGGYVWERGFPPHFEGSGTAPDDRPGETPLLGSTTFPHRLPALAGDPDAKELRRLASVVYATPLGDAFVAQLGERAVQELGLGADDVPDLLFLGFSECDVLGHACGPYSQEVTSLLLSTNAELEHLFALLDQRVGAGRWVAALSADHGVLELPESLAARGVDAHRVSTAPLSQTLKDVRPTVQERFGADFFLSASGDGVLLDRQAMATAGADAAAVRRAYADALLAGVPWLARAYTQEELERPADDDGADPLRPVVMRSFLAERSPDVVFVREPWTLLGSPSGTSHGTPYDYDRHVPLAFYGPGSPAEERYDPCATVDLVPTLLARAGLPVPAGLDGHVLEGSVQK